MKADVRKNRDPGRLEIVATSDELTVTKVASRSPKAYLFGVGLFLYLWFLCINLIGQAHLAVRLAAHPSIARTDLFTSLCLFAFPLLGCVVFLWIVLQWASSIFAGREVLRCSRDSVEITTISLGRVRRRLSFAVVDIELFEFATGTPERNAAGGLRFVASGRPVLFFAGLTASEARPILLELGQLGVEVAVDRAAPVTTGVETSRRRSFLG